MTEPLLDAATETPLLAALVTDAMADEQKPDRARYVVVRDLIQYAEKQREPHTRLFLYMTLGSIDAMMVASDTRERELRREIVQTHHMKLIEKNGIGTPLCECKNCALWRILEGEMSR